MLNYWWVCLQWWLLKLCHHSPSLMEILEVLEKLALNAVDKSIRGSTVVFKVLSCGTIVQNHSCQGHLRYGEIYCFPDPPGALDTSAVVSKLVLAISHTALCVFMCWEGILASSMWIYRRVSCGLDSGWKQLTAPTLGLKLCVVCNMAECWLRVGEEIILSPGYKWRRS